DVTDLLGFCCGRESSTNCQGVSTRKPRNSSGSVQSAKVKIFEQIIQEPPRVITQSAHKINRVNWPEITIGIVNCPYSPLSTYQNTRSCDQTFSVIANDSI